MENQKSSQKKVTLSLLSQETLIYANPMILLINMKGGKRAEAGQWFLEIQKLLYGIHKSIEALETFMNQRAMEKKVSVDGKEIHMSDKEIYWMFTYLIDNAILRVFACMEKLAQMVRVFYEYEGNGGTLEVIPRSKCTCGVKEIMNEKNCSFGNVINYLRKYPREKIIDDALEELAKSSAVNNLSPYRSGFVHRRNKIDKSVGLDPEVKSRYKENNTVETTFSFDGGLPGVNWFRIEISNAQNAIVECINKIDKIIFPRDFKVNIIRKEK